jgi:hypothetical protein
MTQQRNVPQPGEWLEGWYPIRNRVDDDGGYAPRHLCCLAIRDLHREPLELETIERRPLTRRGRYLMFAWDEDIAETRCFYLAQLTDGNPGSKSGTLQIVGFDEDNPNDNLSRIGPEFGPSIFARATLAEACRRLRQQGRSTRFRVAADDVA